MRNRLAPFLLLTLMAPVQARPIGVELNGQSLNGDPPLMQSGRVLVPLRTIFEALGAEVKFDAASKSIHAQRKATVVELVLGQAQAQVSGNPVKLEVPAAALQGKTYVPLRFVAEAFGAQVAWDGAASTVRIQDGPEVFNPAVHLKRLVVGHQAGILKVYDLQRKEAFSKGLDDRNLARFDDASRAQLFTALALDEGRLEEAADRIMAGWDGFPHKESVALLGAIGSSPRLSGAARQKLQTFVTRAMTTDKDVVVRRQALLALAIMRDPLPQTVEIVARVFETTDNLWETFPVQQFFEYHAATVRALPEYQRLRQRLSQVQSLYTANVIGYLDGTAERLGQPNVGY